MNLGFSCGHDMSKGHAHSIPTTVWFGWFLWHINYCRLFDAKSSFYLYIYIYIYIYIYEL